jgi:transcriptional regulator with PAS, ATPase and Fis domain
LARIIHQISARDKGPFVAVNMPAFSNSLFEDDIFGHIRGAYTGAVSDKRGFFETAQGGTLFLDEITELAPAMQGKLLRVIEEKEFYRLGSTQIVNVDLRILSASNRNVSEAMTSGHLRRDLYFRLNEYHIHIPELRRRPKDIPVLANRFMKLHARKNNKPVRQISYELTQALQQYDFPGNVRELENIIASAVLLEATDTLRLSSAQNLLLSSKLPLSRPDEAFLTLDELQQRQILQALHLTSGNRTRAARMLGIGLRTLQRKLKSLETYAPK